MKGAKLPIDYSRAMAVAIKAASAVSEEVPVAALLYSPDGQVLAISTNNRIGTNDPTGHAEIVALREGALALKDWRLEGCTLVVTLEPCIMCAGAILASRIQTLVFGAYDLREGAGGSIYDVLRDGRLNHSVEVVPGVMEKECSQLIGDFFGTKRS